MLFIASASKINLNHDNAAVVAAIKTSGSKHVQTCSKFQGQALLEFTDFFNELLQMKHLLTWHIFYYYLPRFRATPLTSLPPF